MRSTYPILLAIAAVSAIVPAAGADGLPVLGMDVGGTGVVNASRTARLITLPAGDNTVVARVRVRNGTVLASTTVPGTFTIPAVAYDGTPAGLSGDGRTLVLIEPRQSFPRETTAFARLSVTDSNLKLQQLFRLRGDFSLDAVSPSGRRIFLIQYLSRTDPTLYAVRALDVSTGRLLPRPIVDRSDPDEEMRGEPLRRVTSAGGRWAYTLYDGNGVMPFVHALDTATATAHCIDLPSLTRTEISGLRLRLSRKGRTLDVGGVVEIDTRTLAVR